MSEDKERDSQRKKEKIDALISKQLQEVEIRSSEVQEIMGFIPHWIIRGGITVIFLIIVLILIGSYFFKYPDIIMSNITVTTENPPATLVARSTGKIDALMVHDKQKINEGDLLAIIENSVNHNHLFQLQEQLNAMRHFFTHFDTPPIREFDKNYSLGQLQSSYAAFLNSYADYQHFVNLDFHRKKTEATNNQIARYKRVFEQLQRQYKIMQEELALTKQEFERSEKLHKDGVISKSDFDRAKSTYLQKDFSVEGAKTSLSNSRIQITQLEQSVMELQLDYRESKKRIELALGQAYKNLNGQISQWETNFVLRAPISGTVTFTKIWSVNQNVTSGAAVMTIIPADGGRIIGKVVLPIQGSGKVKVDQKVNIKLTNFPHMDFGIVSGIITSKSLVASDNFYSLEVVLPQGLLTSYGEQLEFSQEMQGTAEIITDDIRLLERVFKPIKAMLDKM